MPRDPLPDPLPDVRRAVGDRIRHHRERCDLTQWQLCEAAEIPRSTLQEIERGTTDARLSWLARIARALNTPLGQLLDVDVPRPPR